MFRFHDSGIHAAIAVTAVAMCLTTGGAVAQTAPALDRGEIGGAWIRQDFSRISGNQTGGTINPSMPRDASGNPVPLQPWALQVFEQRYKGSVAGKPFASTKSRCLPAGMPKSMDPPASLALQILVTPGQVTVLFEEFNDFRIIHMGGEHPKDLEPRYFGNSIAHWEDKTLVVDTVGFTTDTTIDSLGTPHSDAMHIVERIRRIGPDRLEDEMTITDPKAYTKPWIMKSTFRKLETGLDEFFCDNDRNLPDENGITGVALPNAKP